MIFFPLLVSEMSSIISSLRLSSPTCLVLVHRVDQPSYHSSLTTHVLQGSHCMFVWLAKVLVVIVVTDIRLNTNNRGLYFIVYSFGNQDLYVIALRV